MNCRPRRRSGLIGGPEAFRLLGSQGVSPVAGRNSGGVDCEDVSFGRDVRVPGWSEPSVGPKAFCPPGSPGVSPGGRLNSGRPIRGLKTRTARDDTTGACPGGKAFKPPVAARMDAQESLDKNGMEWN